LCYAPSTAVSASTPSDGAVDVDGDGDGDGVDGQDAICEPEMSSSFRRVKAVNEARPSFTYE